MRSDARVPGSLAVEGLTNPSPEQLTRAGAKAARSRKSAKDLASTAQVSLGWKQPKSSVRSA